MSAVASQITSLTIVYSTVYISDKKSIKLRVTGLCVRWPVNSPHKWPVTWKKFPFDDVIMWELECGQVSHDTLKGVRLTLGFSFGVLCLGEIKYLIGLAIRHWVLCRHKTSSSLIVYRLIWKVIQITLLSIDCNTYIWPFMESKAIPNFLLCAYPNLLKKHHCMPYSMSVMLDLLIRSETKMPNN